MRKLITACAALTLGSNVAAAQGSAPRTTPDLAPRAKPAWVSRHDIAPFGIAVAGVALASLADESLAQRLQRPSLQNNRFLHDGTKAVQVAGDPGAIVTSVALYAIASATHNEGLADAGKHSTEAIALSAVFTQALKLSVGRGRPNVSADSDAFRFHPLHSHGDYNSFPSGHTTASFAAATVFSLELRRTHPDAAKWASPALYTVATLVGGARMYNNRHWLSDVVAGAVIGSFSGQRIVGRAHE